MTILGGGIIIMVCAERFLYYILLGKAGTGLMPGMGMENSSKKTKPVLVDKTHTCAFCQHCKTPDERGLFL
jgi:hypothetical protein